MRWRSDEWPRREVATPSTRDATIGTYFQRSPHSFKVTSTEPHRRLAATKRHRLGVAASGLAAFLWGFGGIFVVLATVSGLVLTFYRLWFGAALLSFLVYVSGRRLTLATVRASWLAGLLLSCDMAMTYSAFKLTSVADVTVIGAFQPALVLVAARRLFGERMRRGDVFWILLAMVGISVAVLGHAVSGHRQFDGDLLAVGGLVCWSAYWLVSKHARKATNAMEYTACVTIVAAIALTPVVLLSGQSLGRVEARDWLWITVLALVPGSGNLVMNWAHRYVDASLSSVIVCLSPLIAALAALVILGQQLTVVQVGGVILGLAAIAVVAARHQEPSVSPLT